MRASSPQWPYIIGTSHGVVTQVDAWMAGKLVAEDVPILDGNITFDDTATLRRRLTITVPAREPLKNWDPGTDPVHPLAAYGQRLHVRSGIIHPDGFAELQDFGWYLITDWETSEDDTEVQVSADDVVRLIRDARLYWPESSPPGSSFFAEFTRLIADILPTRLDPSLADAPMPRSRLWERNRDEALDDLCKSWGARWYVDDSGTAVAAAAYAPVPQDSKPDLVLVEGLNGTMVGRVRTGARERLYNAVSAKGKPPEDAPDGTPDPHAVAEITDPRSPIRVDGPYGRVPRFYASDLMPDEATCLSAARAILTKASTVGRSENVVCIPDARVQLGDVARVYSSGDAFTGRVTAIKFPLIAAGGAMELSVSNAPELEEES